MEMKVGIVDSDNAFVKRFCSVMNSKFDDLEVFVFPNLKQAQTAAKKSILHLLLVDSSLVSKSSNYNSLIPLQCKTAILTNEKVAVEDCPLPSVCKYKSVDDWYALICQFCSSDFPLDVKGGEMGARGERKTCLFVPGDVSTMGAADAATEFCRFLCEKGLLAVVLNPFLESGESVWKMVENVEYFCDVTCICLNDLDDDKIVIPFINSVTTVFVTDGSKFQNENIVGLLHRLPMITALSKEEICEKSYLLYTGFNSKKGNLIQTNELGKLGGLGDYKDNQATFEKLVTVLNV